VEHGRRRQTAFIDETQLVFFALPSWTSHLAAACALGKFRKIFPDSKSIIETALLVFAAAAFALFWAFDLASSVFFCSIHLAMPCAFHLLFCLFSNQLVFLAMFYVLLASAYSTGFSFFHFAIRSRHLF
jgi:hypothetical protein